VTHMGTYEELLTSSSSFAHLLDDIHQHELEEQQSIEYRNQQSIIDPISAQIDDANDTLSPPIDVEIKQEGMVKWHVYTAYLRAGLGLFFGFILTTGIFSARELIAVFSDRWLAKWSEDESHRYRVFNNCTNTSRNTIQSMNDTEWTNHRNRRFYIYCGISLFRVPMPCLK
jgi:hypothetical protein